MKKKPTKYDYKRVLPTELYINEKKGKRGVGEMPQAVNTRLTKDEYKEFLELLQLIKVKRSNFVRYAIRKVSLEVREIVEHEQKKMIDEEKEK
jgi:hypothetical protein